jgi:hypothetical protein
MEENKNYDFKILEKHKRPRKRTVFFLFLPILNDSKDYTRNVTGRNWKDNKERLN